MYWVHSETCEPKFLASHHIQYQNDFMQHTFSDFRENCVINVVTSFYAIIPAFLLRNLGKLMQVDSSSFIK